MMDSKGDILRPVVSQETFDAAVKENAELFEQEPAEAVQTTIEQYTCEGICLDNVIKTVEQVFGECPLVKRYDIIEQALNSGDLESPTLTDALHSLHEYLSTNAYRIKAGKLGLHFLLIKVAQKTEDLEKVQDECFSVLTVLMTNYPDLANDDSVRNFQFDILKSDKSAGVKSKILDWVRVCCVKHEINRNEYMSSGLVELLLSLLSDDPDPKIVGSVCGVISVMCVDDDVRATVSNFHKNACEFAESFMMTLIGFLKDTKYPRVKIIHTIKALLVSDEYCATFSKTGSVDVVIDLIFVHMGDKDALVPLINLLAALGRSDDMKDELVKKEIPNITKEILNKYMVKGLLVISSTLLLIAQVCLRKPTHGALFVETAVVDLIVQVMKAYKDDMVIQKHGCIALRNIASRNRALADAFISADVQDWLDCIDKKHTSIKEHTNAVRVAIGWEAELEERWTGKYGNRLAQD